MQYYILVITTATSGGLQLGTGLKLGTSELILVSFLCYVIFIIAGGLQLGMTNTTGRVLLM